MVLDQLWICCTGIRGFGSCRLPCFVLRFSCVLVAYEARRILLSILHGAGLQRAPDGRRGLVTISIAVASAGIVSRLTWWSLRL